MTGMRDCGHTACIFDLELARPEGAARAGRALCSRAVDRPAIDDRTPPTPPLTVGVVFVRNLLSGVRAKGLDDAPFLR